MYISTYSILSALGFISIAGLISNLIIIFASYFILFLVNLLFVLIDNLPSITDILSHILRLILHLVMLGMPLIVYHIKLLNFYFTIGLALLMIMASFWTNIKYLNLDNHIIIPISYTFRFFKCYFKHFKYSCHYLKCLLIGSQKDSNVIVKSHD